MTDVTIIPDDRQSVVPGSKMSEIELMQYHQKLATIFSKSGMVPLAYKDKPDAIFVAFQMGNELGFKPSESLRSIAVVNGTPSIWGDAMLALVKASGKLKDFRESFEGERGTDSYAAICISWRNGMPEPVTTAFSVADAKKANLWGKSGTWTTHPYRMLMYKARAFNLRDNFTDVIRGLHSSEELEGEEMVNVSPRLNLMKMSQQSAKEHVQIDTQAKKNGAGFAQMSQKIIDCPTKEVLESVGIEIGGMKDILTEDEIDELKDAYLTKMAFFKSVNGEKK